MDFGTCNLFGCPSLNTAAAGGNFHIPVDVGKDASLTDLLAHVTFHLVALVPMVMDIPFDTLDIL